jgi:hypothetical protein
MEKSKFIQNMSADAFIIELLVTTGKNQMKWFGFHSLLLILHIPLHTN